MTIQRCLRCGTARRGDLQVCARCELPFPGPDDDIDSALPRPAVPATSQSHGTMVAFLLLGFVVLAVLLALSVRGVGPFSATVVSAAPAVDGTSAVTVEVRNEGRKGGQAKCQLALVAATTGEQRENYQFLSRRVPGNGRITQTLAVPLPEGTTTSATITC